LFANLGDELDFVAEDPTVLLDLGDVLKEPDLALLDGVDLLLLDLLVEERLLEE